MWTYLEKFIIFITTLAVDIINVLPEVHRIPLRKLPLSVAGIQIIRSRVLDPEYRCNHLDRRLIQKSLDKSLSDILYAGKELEILYAGLSQRHHNR